MMVLTMNGLCKFFIRKLKQYAICILNAFYFNFKIKYYEQKNIIPISFIVGDIFMLNTGYTWTIFE